MRSNPVRAALLAILGGAACHRAPPAAPVPADLVITLERTPCYGRCATYTVALHADGTVHFTGTRFTAVTGPQAATIPRDSVAAIARALDALGFDRLPEQMTYGTPSCPERIADLPTAVVTRRAGGVTKRVVHSPGCSGAPQALTALEQRIDAVAGTARWIGAQ